MTRIYLIRHAEAEGNLFRVAHGQFDSTITPQGYRQLAFLRERFREIPIDAVYGSDLTRTRTTASAVYGPKNLAFHPMPLLREVCLGPWEQMTWGEIQEQYPEMYQNFNRRPDLWHLPGAEDLDVVQQRLLQAVKQIAAENPGKTVAATSHGAALRSFLGMLQGKSLAEIGSTPHGDNTAVSLLEVKGDQIRVVFRDDASHIPSPLSTFGRQTWHKRDTAIEPGLRFQWEPTERGWHVSAYLEEKRVGFLSMFLEDSALRLRSMEILPAHRGHGYGVQLLGQAYKLCRKEGRERIAITCPQDMVAYFAKYAFPTEITAADGQASLQLDLSRQIREIPPVPASV